MPRSVPIQRIRAIRAACVLAAACCAIGCGRSRARESAPREDAYRLNNIGVARLEQYEYRGAADTFRRARALDAGLAMPRLNLAIALYYDNQLEEAAREARAAAQLMPEAPQAPYVLGLVARAAGRDDEAAGHFRRVLALDRDDAGARIQLGQVLLGQRQFAEAIALFVQAARMEPFNATAAYGLATAFARAGRSEDARTAMARFQQLRDNPAAFTYASEYLAQGRYAEAIVSTGLEPDLVDRAVPDVQFTDATAAMLAGGADTDGGIRGIALADVDGDGQLDLVAVSDRGVVVRRNEGGRFGAARTTDVAATTPRGVVAGDYDNDGRPDLFVLGDRGDRLLHQEADGTFRDVTERAGLAAAAVPARTAAFVDVDHDGDLDIAIGAAAGGVRLLRNDGNGRFADASAESGMAAAGVNAVALAPTDFDNDRDVDLFVASDAGPPVLFSNMRDGTFRDVAADAGLPGAAKYTAVAAADVNKDGAIDFFLARAGQPGLFVTSGRSARFTAGPAPAGTRDATAAQFVDYDNDGLLDLLVLTPSGPRLWRNVGDGWVDVSDRALSTLRRGGERAIAMAIGDIDGDGDEDALVLLASGQLRVWRNDGGSRRPSLHVRLSARVSNRSALGAKVEMAAGSLRQKIEMSAAAPAVAPADIVFGLGRRARADVVRVLWPAGIVQAEAEIASASIAITELNRKPSSCPFLFTWNGSRFEFITDFMGGGEMGAWTAPGERSPVPDPVEYVRIPRGQLVPHDGRLELRVTNELEEALFIDRLQLVAVAHPAGIDVYPSTGLRSPSGRAPFELFTSAAPRPPLHATDDRGRNVLDRLLAVDRRAVDGFELEPVQGYAREHALTLDLGVTPPASRVRLLLTGWTDYAFSSDNAAAHQAGLVFEPPALQARDERGQWRTVVPEIGLPTGRPQTLVVDVTDALAAGRALRGSSRNEVRIVTTARVYWDQILVDTSQPEPFVSTPLRAVEARLRSRGYSAELSSSAPALPTYDYHRVSAVAPWKTMPGLYTRPGDVRTLLEASDDQFVVGAPGDEIALAFDAAALPPLREGWERTFLLQADGFSKEMNLRSASPDRVEPLPFHAMSRYPYAPPEHYPRTPAHDRYRSAFNTRRIGGPVPTLEQTVLRYTECTDCARVRGAHGRPGGPGTSGRPD